MVTAQDHRERPLRQDVCDALGDLVVGLGDVARTEDVADVAHADRLGQVDSVLVAIFLVQCRDPPQALWPETRARAERAADVKWHADECDVVFAYLLDVLE